MTIHVVARGCDRNRSSPFRGFRHHPTVLAGYRSTMVSFLRRLFGIGPVELAPGRGWTVDVVGEADFQDELRVLKGSNPQDRKLVATLVPEPSNKVAARVVRVEIGGRPVGYLSQKLAKEYALDTPSECTAKITGGFDLGDGTRAQLWVKLNLAWPPRPAV